MNIWNVYMNHLIGVIEETNYVGIKVDLLEWMTYWTMIGGKDD